MDFSFSGKVALVTGAAHGIGRSICAELSRGGATGGGADILLDDLEATKRACSETGGTCQSGLLDVIDSGAVNELVARIEAECGRLDILANVAGGVLGQVG